MYHVLGCFNPPNTFGHKGTSPQVTRPGRWDHCLDACVRETRDSVMGTKGFLDHQEVIAFPTQSLQNWPTICNLFHLPHMASFLCTVTTPSQRQCIAASFRACLDCVRVNNEPKLFRYKAMASLGGTDHRPLPVGHVMGHICGKSSLQRTSVTDNADRNNRPNGPTRRFRFCCYIHAA